MRKSNLIIYVKLLLNVIHNVVFQFYIISLSIYLSISQIYVYNPYFVLVHNTNFMRSESDFVGVQRVLDISNPKIYEMTVETYHGGARMSLAKASGKIPNPVSSRAHKSSAIKTETTNSFRSVSYETWICMRPVTCLSFAICS